MNQFVILEILKTYMQHEFFLRVNKKNSIS